MTKRYRTSEARTRSYASLMSPAGDDLDLGSQVMLRAEAEHVAGLLQAADQGSGDDAALGEERRGR